MRIMSVYGMFCKLDQRRNVEKRHSIFIGISILIILFFLCGCGETVQKEPEKSSYGIISPTLSPDNKKLALVCGKGGDWYLMIHDISTGKTRKFKPTKNQFHGSPAYSPDGKKITFASGSGDNRNIFIMNEDGSNIRQLTHTYNKQPIGSEDNVAYRINGRPSFSSDGKRIIFVRSGVKRQRAFPLGGEMVSHYDVYEVNVETEIERRLTNYKFYNISRPYYLPEEKKFIFSGTVSAGLEEMKAYESKYKDNKIYIMDGKNNKLHPIFVYGDWTSNPSVSKDDTILFLARSNHLDGVKGPYNYDLFINRKGKMQRLTHRQFSRIAEPSLSHDGLRVVFLASVEKKEGPSVWIMNSDGTGLTKVNLPAWNEMD